MTDISYAVSKDIGRILLAKTDTIIESWIDCIREDTEIESTEGLAYKSVKNSIPLVLEALASFLSQLELTDVGSIVSMVKEALEPSAREKNLDIVLNCDRVIRLVFLLLEQS